MGKKKGRGGPQAVGPRTKTRKRILTWYFSDVPGHKVVHRMYIETEVMEVKNGPELLLQERPRTRVRKASRTTSRRLRASCRCSMRVRTPTSA